MLKYSVSGSCYFLLLSPCLALYLSQLSPATFSLHQMRYMASEVHIQNLPSAVYPAYLPFLYLHLLIQERKIGSKLHKSNYYRDNLESSFIFKKCEAFTKTRDFNSCKLQISCSVQHTLTDSSNNQWLLFWPLWNRYKLLAWWVKAQECPQVL